MLYCKGEAFKDCFTPAFCTSISFIFLSLSFIHFFVEMHKPLLINRFSGLTILLLLLIFPNSYSQNQNDYLIFKNIGGLGISNLPIIIIDSNGNNIPNDPRIKAHMGIVYNGEGVLNRVSDPFNEYSGMISIELRGSSSLWFDKKSYSLETQDNIGDNLNVPLLGMPKENDWVLYGPYSDKSLMRNALAYHLGINIMNWAPRTRFCELVINNEYLGVYLLGETIKPDKNRVDIAKLTAKDTVGNDLTGGYIIKIDKETGAGAGEGWNSSYKPNNGKYQQILFQYHYPKAKDIQPGQASYIEEYVYSFEKCLKSSDFMDSNNGYRKYIDVNSFIDFFIVNEVSRNIDGYRRSSFMFMDKESKGGKLSMGPLWDFNLGFGNADYCDGSNITGFSYLFNNECSDDGFLVPFWWDRFLEDSVFQKSLNKRWQELRTGCLHEDSIFYCIDSMTVLLDEAQERNYQKWRVMGLYLWPNSYIGESFTQEVNYLKAWIKNRLVWLDNNLPVNNNNDTVHITQDKSYLVYPNPFTDHIRIDIGSNLNLNYQLAITLMDFTGRKIYAGLVKNNILEINTAGLHNGIYVYYLEINGKFIKSGKLIKQ